MRYRSLPIEQLSSWAQINDVKLHNAVIVADVIDEHGQNKGGGVLATSDLGPGDVVLTVPGDLLVSKSNVELYAKSDRHLREVLEAVGPFFSQSSRLSAMILLLLQFTYSSPDFDESKIGVTSPLADWVKFLPKEIPLPTFYSDSEQQMLTGTSLAAALDQKLKSLEKEFERLRIATERIGWCQTFWWDENHGKLTIDDWKTVDAVYRSRAMELPLGVGDVMTPVVDMVNHAPNNRHNARFDVDEHGNVLLIIRDEKHVKAGEEITIIYGSGGACEMIFSYGFLDQGAQHAREMFLNLEMPEDDPLGLAKTKFSKEAPGVRIYTDHQGHTHWDSPFAWWACINEEDGLDFRVLQLDSGEKELQAIWKGTELQAHDDLQHRLLKDPLRELFQLRAAVLVQKRVEEQGGILGEGDNDLEGCSVVRDDSHETVAGTIRRLRVLEMELLLACYQAIEVEKTQLLASETVRTFLEPQTTFHQTGANEEDDFS